MNYQPVTERSTSSAQKTAACPELSRVRQYLRDGFPEKSSSWQITAYSKIATDIIDAD